MEPQTFSPQLGDLYGLLAVCGGLFVLFVFLAWRLGKLKGDPRRRVLLPMLAYFMALLGLMGAGGAFWSLQKYPEVAVTKTKLMVGDQEYPRPRKAEIRLENYEAGGLGGANRVLLIQTKDRRTWAFPADRYPLVELMRALD